MNHPTSQQILRVINNFKKVLPLTTLPAHLQMMEGAVNINHSCGTVHCHGGWYAVAACNVDEPLCFTDGAKKLSNDLSFNDWFALELWARNNYTIWGNNYGENMFSGRIAFKSSDRKDGAMNLQHIIDHWTEVYERILKIENETAEV